MDAPANFSDLVSEFAGITGASSLIADHYLSACNYDLNRAIEFYFEHPPAPSQAGPRGGTSAADEDVGAMAAYGEDADIAERPLAQGGFAPTGRDVADDDEELQRALEASIAGAGPAPGRGGQQGLARFTQRRVEEVEVLDDDEEHLPDAEELLQDMARQHDAARAAEREARQRMEEAMDRILGGPAGRGPGAIRVPPGFPPTFVGPLGGLPSIFPGMMGPAPPPPPAGHGPPSLFYRVPPGGDVAGRGGRWRDESSGGGGRERGGAGQAQRRRIEVQAGGEAGGGSEAGTGAAAASGRGVGGWDDELELPEGMSRHELEEARMMEAALLGVPYEGRGLRDFAAGARGGVGSLVEEREVAAEVLEHRELRWDQDRAYEESLAADRAKEQAAARAKAEAEAQERAQREAEAAAERAAAEAAARLATLVATKASRLPAEPPSSSSDAVTVMVRLPDGSRHSRRFALTDRLCSLFDFVDVELDSTNKAAAAGGDGGGGGVATAGAGAEAQSSLKPGTYNLVAQFPRRVFVEDESGSKTFAEAGLAGGGGAAFFIEQKGG